MDRDRFPADPWRLVETRQSIEDVGLTETLFALGNGYLGMRGNPPEGRHAHEHGTFINGLHETFPIRHAEQAFGFAETGQTIINAPDAKIMRVYVDDEPLAFDVADFREYERVLDMRRGVLTRHMRWMTPSGKDVVVDLERMVSFEERHLAVMRVSVTVLNADAPVVINCQLVNRQDGEDVYGGMAPHASAPTAPAAFDPRKAEAIDERVLQPVEYWQEGLRSVLSYQVTRSGMTVAVIADHEIDTANEYTARTLIEPDIAKNVFRVQAKAGVPVTVTKFVSYHSSRGVPARELVDRGRRTLDRARVEGVEYQFEEQEAWCRDFWERSDVQVAGDDALQQAIRWCLFQLAQATARADGRGVPAKGLTGSGYSGHYFWDTEVYVLPFLTYTTPHWARNALRMRYHMLPAARRRAAQLNEAGALFPWRTINGEEASAYYAAGTAQYHINADVSFAVGKYVRATGDMRFLYTEGVDILVETARLWATLGFWRVNEDSAEVFHIHGVTGPDEYTTVVNDNLFTNVMARFNLRAASRVVREMADRAPDEYRAMMQRLDLDPAEADAWDAAADAMHIPYSEGLGIHPQDAVFLEKEVWDLENTPAEQHPLLLNFHPLVIYRYQVLKQADVVLALFLQGNHFTAEEKRADFDYYDPLTTGDSTLSAVVQSILAAEVGYRELALEYFHEAAFVDLEDLHRNTSDGAHVASAGGVWTALVSGFGGMRDHGGDLSFDPRLPAEWPSLSYKLRWRGMQLDVTVTATEITVAAERAEHGETEEPRDDVDFAVRGEMHTVRAGESVSVPLDGQGPILTGRPTLSDIGDAMREDGTRLSASVPVSTATTGIPIISGIIPVVSGQPVEEGNLGVDS
ncbi:glycoside hydrolase family 65 protein [Microbacterium invictum]|uniref:Alpha,alpha-trehalose phosphorylase n=1 Tax=Microbacterium invictum TaxID=515415 RepID=A0AA40VLB6_9MICO|nr:glycoside hydrolase family 65 protein [Microbacterium invictum]MBB4138424.1 alpha,alpha-trehalose phosphorylase [Microbacterium invictum]